MGLNPGSNPKLALFWFISLIHSYHSFIICWAAINNRNRKYNYIETKTCAITVSSGAYQSPNPVVLKWCAVIRIQVCCGIFFNNHTLVWQYSIVYTRSEFIFNWLCQYVEANNLDLNNLHWEPICHHLHMGIINVWRIKSSDWQPVWGIILFSRTKQWVGQ